MNETYGNKYIWIDSNDVYVHPMNDGDNTREEFIGLLEERQGDRLKVRTYGPVTDLYQAVFLKEN